MVTRGNVPFMVLTDHHRYSPYKAMVEVNGVYDSIEAHYRSFKKTGVKGAIVQNWGVEVDFTDNEKVSQECKEYYTYLWTLFLNENKNIVEYLQQYRGFSDEFANEDSEISPAIEIYNYLVNNGKINKRGGLVKLTNKLSDQALIAGIAMNNVFKNGLFAAISGVATTFTNVISKLLYAVDATYVAFPVLLKNAKALYRESEKDPNNAEKAEAFEAAKVDYNRHMSALFNYVNGKLNYTNVRGSINSLVDCMVYLYMWAIYVKTAMVNDENEDVKNFFMIAYRHCHYIQNVKSDKQRELAFKELKTYVKKFSHLWYYDLIKVGHINSMVYAEYIILLVQLMNNCANVHMYMHKNFNYVTTNPDYHKLYDYYVENANDEIRNILKRDNEDNPMKDAMMGNQVQQMIADLIKSNEAHLSTGTSVVVQRPEGNVINTAEVVALQILIETSKNYKNFLEAKDVIELNDKIFSKYNNVYVVDLPKITGNTISCGYANLIEATSVLTDMMSDAVRDIPGANGITFIDGVHSWYKLSTLVESAYTKDLKNDFGRNYQKQTAVFNGSVVLLKGKTTDKDNYLNEKRFTTVIMLDTDGIAMVTSLYKSFINGDAVLTHEQEMAMWFLIRNFYPSLTELRSMNVLPKYLESAKSNVNYNNAKVVILDKRPRVFYKVLLTKCGLNTIYKHNDVKSNTVKNYKWLTPIAIKNIEKAISRALNYNRAIDITNMKFNATIVNDSSLVFKSIDGAGIVFTNNIGARNPKAIKVAAAQGGTNLKVVLALLDINDEHLQVKLNAFFNNDAKVAKINNMIANHDFDGSDLIICNDTAIKAKDGVRYSNNWTCYVTDSYHKVEYTFNASKGLLGYLVQPILEIVEHYIKMLTNGNVIATSCIKSIMAVPHFDEELKDTCLVSVSAYRRMCAGLYANKLYRQKIGNRRITQSDIRLLLVAYPKAMKDRIMKIKVVENLGVDIMYPSYGMNWVSRDFDGDNMSAIVMFDHGIETDEYGFTTGENVYSDNAELNEKINTAIVNSYNSDVIDVNKAIYKIYSRYVSESKVCGLPYEEGVFDLEKQEYSFPEEFLNSKRFGLYVYNEIAARLLSLNKDLTRKEYESGNAKVWTVVPVKDMTPDELNMINGTLAHELLLGVGVVINFNKVGRIIDSCVYSRERNHFGDFDYTPNEGMEDLNVFYGNHILYSGANEKLIKGEKKRVNYVDVLIALKAVPIIFNDDEDEYGQ